MKDEWDDPDFAIQWDQTALVINPTRAEQLDILVSVIEQTCQKGAAILDLGIGSGLVEDMLFARRADTHVVGVESSAAMIELAKRRLTPYEPHYTIIQHDFSDVEGLSLPSQKFQIVLSVQALHHLPHPVQQEVIRFAANILDTRGIFLLLDRIAFDLDHFSNLYIALRNRLEQISEIKSGWSADHFRQRLQAKDDYPAPLEKLLTWMQEAGLYTTCLHSHLDRMLIAGVKD